MTQTFNMTTFIPARANVLGSATVFARRRAS